MIFCEKKIVQFKFMVVVPIFLQFIYINIITSFNFHSVYKYFAIFNPNG